MPPGDSPIFAITYGIAGRPPASRKAVITNHSRMGLDMYAARRTYVKQWDGEPPEKRYQVRVTRGGKPVKGIQPELISFVEEDVMYWRRADHIHRWFVKNVQNGYDDCGSHDVSPEQLRMLLSLCEEVLDASELIDGEASAGVVFDQENPKGKVLTGPGKVIKDTTTAEELLPRMDGWFAEPGDYNEDYLTDVQETRDWIVRTLAELETSEEPSTIVYSSSW